MNVLMFGWELPPKISGGLGTACYGLTKAMSAHAATAINFVLPRQLQGEDTSYMRLLPLPEAPENHREEIIVGAYNNGILPDVLAYAERTTQLFGVTTVDIIHAHDWLTIPAALRARAHRQAPFVLHIHSTEYDRAQDRADPAIVAIERDGLLAADLVIAVSAVTKRDIVARYGIAESKIAVVHNGLTTSQAPRLPRERKYISFISRVSSQKGPRYFLEAARLALQVDPNLQFVMAGDGDQLPLMKALAHESRMDANICFPGFLSNEEMAILLDQSAAYVMPSVAEPFGIAALEAVDRYTPVILSEHCGVCEVLQHAIKIRPDDVEELARAMLTIVRRPAQAQAMAERAATQIEQLTWENAAARTLNLYRQLGDFSRT